MPVLQGKRASEISESGCPGSASRRELAELILRYRDEQASRRSRRRVAEGGKPRFTAGQRLLILDSWLRSKLPAGDFAPLVGLSLHTLRAWKARFAEFSLPVDRRVGLIHARARDVGRVASVGGRARAADKAQSEQV